MIIPEKDISKLAEFYSMSQEELEELPLKEIKKMAQAMQDTQRAKVAVDDAYAAYVRKRFTPYGFLRQWFSDQEIVNACAHCDVSKYSLTEELPIETQKGTKPHEYNGMEYLRTGYESIRAFTKSGEELLHKRKAWCNVYRKVYEYQGLQHGDVIQKLVYDRYPWLEKYGFSFYEYRDYGWEKDNYEIYPKNNIYTPLAALMSGDIDAIKARNRDYAKKYNSGQYKPDIVEKRFEENAAFFEEIQANIPYTGK